jgi:hypothetical protein
VISDDDEEFEPDRQIIVAEITPELQQRRRKRRRPHPRDDRSRGYPPPPKPEGDQ